LLAKKASIRWRDGGGTDSRKGRIGEYFRANNKGLNRGFDIEIVKRKRKRKKYGRRLDKINTPRRGKRIG